MILNGSLPIFLNPTAYKGQLCTPYNRGEDNSFHASRNVFNRDAVITILRFRDYYSPGLNLLRKGSSSTSLGTRLPA